MTSVLREAMEEWPQLRVVQHAQNRGRGDAIRTGVATALGDLVLYADADGATPIDHERELRRAIEQGADIAVGSRVAEQNAAVCCRAFHRKVIGKSFRRLVKLLVGVPVKDTQCGFKMWRREVGQHVLSFCKDKQWLLDVEFLAVAHRLGYRITEVPVTWTEMAGSKVRLLRDSWRMFRGLWQIRRSVRKLERVTLQVPTWSSVSLPAKRLSESAGKLPESIARQGFSDSACLPGKETV
jgi:dolichyl-phosphate beta-glucosyltransferase